MLTIDTAINSYLNTVGSIENDLTAIDLWARRIGLMPDGTRQLTSTIPDIDTTADIDKVLQREPMNLGEMCPLSLGLPDQSADQYLRLPIDPVIAVSGGNQIATRHVAKSQMRGTIKESWAQDDWKIEIRGVLVAENAKKLADLVQQLKKLLDSDQALCVVCNYLQDCYNIDRLVVQSYQFPATKGLRFQQYSLSCLSDEAYDLLQEL